MGFHAKPSGGYAISSTEGTDNIYAVYDYLHALGYTKACCEGILGNMSGESGLNPWRWQSDTVTYSDGYGLVQFTPASSYINLTGIPDHAPNLSVTQQTAGSSPDDAKAQLYVLANDTLHKWVNTCWRSYWNPSSYTTLYAKHTYILNTYGNGTSLTMSQFSQITDYTDACFAFLACYEGPAIPNYNTRVTLAAQVKTILDPYDPGPTPPGPTPPPGPGPTPPDPGPGFDLGDILIMKKIIDKNRILW